MRVALARHDAVLREAIENCGGWLVKHTGDGVVAAFASARSAVDAAIVAQRCLELPVRMGICTGEVETRDDDYFGPAVNRAARTMAAAHGGQVLVAAATAAIVEGIEFLDLGEHRLRDLSQPQRLYQLRAEGLREIFPAVRTLDLTPGNLPIQATSFLGRETDLAEVVTLLRAARLVTLSGVGGVGKTRLALQVAAEIAADYSDGAWLVELAAVGDPDAIGHAVAGALGIAQQSGRTIAQSLVAALSRRRLLLVLDNCEHLIAAAAELAEDIITQCPRVAVLATSREALMVAGERIWPVPSLAFRGGITAPAVTLFGERARAVMPQFQLEPEAEAVGDICRRLDGIPLAIELAAARIRVMSPAQIRARLDDRFRLLTGGSRRIGAASDAASCGAVVLRPPGAGRAHPPGAMFGLRRRLHLGSGRARLQRQRSRGCRCAGSARLAGAQVTGHQRAVRRDDALRPPRNDPPIRRRAACCSGGSRDRSAAPR
jgi:hypothetical protein